MKGSTALIVAVVIIAVLVGAQLARGSVFLGKDGRQKPAADLKSRRGDGCPVTSSVDRMHASAKSWRHDPFKEGIPIAYQATFDCEQFARLQEGLVPREMEDKWFIYYEGPYLFLHRSWTGQPVYRLTLNGTPSGADVTEAHWSKDLADASTPTQGADYQVRLLDFLLSNLLLGQSRPFPMPHDLPEPMPGVFQHVVAGTGYPQSPPTQKKPWWRIW